MTPPTRRLPFTHNECPHCRKVVLADEPHLRVLATPPGSEEAVIVPLHYSCFAPITVQGWRMSTQEEIVRFFADLQDEHGEPVE
jgi:hypothetical protein